MEQSRIDVILEFVWSAMTTGRTLQRDASTEELLEALQIAEAAAFRLMAERRHPPVAANTNQIAATR